MLGLRGWLVCDSGGVKSVDGRAQLAVGRLRSEEKRVTVTVLQLNDCVSIEKGKGRARDTRRIPAQDIPATRSPTYLSKMLTALNLSRGHEANLVVWRKHKQGKKERAHLISRYALGRKQPSWV